MGVRALLLACVVTAATLAGRSVVSAQEPPDGYLETIEIAVEAFGQGRWAAARAAFERAHAIYPNARTLRGIGMCAFELEQYSDAVRYLRWSLSEDRRALSGGLRSETEELLGRANVSVGYFRVVSDPDEAEFRVDGQVVPRSSSGEVMLSVGERTIRVSAPGYETLTRQIRVVGGEQETLSLSLRRSGLGDPPDLTAALFVAAGAAWLVTPVSIGWWVDRESEIASCASPPPGTVCINHDVLSEQQVAAIATTVTFGVLGLALAATAVAVWALDGREASSAACAPAGVGVACLF